MIINYVSGDFDCDLDVDSESVQECAEFIAAHTMRGHVDFPGSSFRIPKGLPRKEKQTALVDILEWFLAGKGK